MDWGVDGLRRPKTVVVEGAHLFASLRSGDRGDGRDGVTVEAMGEVVTLVSAVTEHFCARHRHYAKHPTRTVSFNHYSSSRRVEKFGLPLYYHFIYIYSHTISYCYFSFGYMIQ